MDPPTMVKTVFKYTSSQQPMFGVLQSPPLHYTSSDPTNFQDISFSSYIKSKDPSPIDDTEISIFDAHKYFSDGAEKQQVHLHPPNNDAVNVNTRPSSVSSVDTSYGRNFRTRSFHATPTASSEASWNSQTGLLANPPGSMGVSLRNVSGEDGRKGGSVARKWIFGRKCCCTGKKSVQVKEAINLSDSDNGGAAVERDGNGKPNYGTVYVKKDSYKVKPMSSTILSGLSHMETQPHKASVVLAPNSLPPPENDFPATDQPRQQRISASGRTFVDGTGGFSFPILNTSAASTKPALKGMIMTKSAIVEDPPRDSLEVFQPMHDQIQSDNPVNLNSRPHFSSGSPRVIANTDDDVGSDASSDLFEIESFSTQTTSYPMYRRMDSLDEAPTFNARRFATANGLNLNAAAGGGGNIQYGRRSLDEPPTPSVAATECYAPSEVSIDWSVTTAEGFDRASVSNFSVSASEVGTAAFLRQRMQQQQEEESGKRKGNGGGGGLLLMSCRQEKAVSVGPQPVKCVEVGGRPPRAGKAALGNDHSARLSLAFAA